MTAGVAIDDRRCVSCHQPVTTPFCAHCGVAEGGMLPAAPLDPAIAAVLHKPNLGAALAAGFWTFANGAPVLGVIYWLMWPILSPVSIGIMIYLFFNGNRVALQRRRFASLAAFQVAQHKWFIASLFLFALLCGMLFFGFLVWMGVMDSLAHDPQ